MPIFPLLLILFFSVPLLEVYLLLQVSSGIGVLWTIFLVILTAVIGSILIRIQGFSLLAQSRQQLASGQLPTDAVFSGVCLLVAGALLLTPGFFTDFIGFVLLTPFLRAMVYKYFVFKVKNRSFRSNKSDQNGNVIEGEFTKKDKS